MLQQKQELTKRELRSACTGESSPGEDSQVMLKEAEMVTAVGRAGTSPEVGQEDSSTGRKMQQRDYQHGVPHTEESLIYSEIPKNYIVK